MSHLRIGLVASLLSLFLIPQAPGWSAEFEIDPTHSSVGFVVKHIVSKVKGQFNEFTGSFRYDPKAPEKSSVEAVLQAHSINTNMAKRDDHLRSPDFFDTAKYPTATFKSTSAKSAGDHRLEVPGVLTLHGVSKPVVLSVQGGEMAKDPWGGTRTGFTATTTINRKDFGISWNKTLDNGGLLIGDEVRIEIEIEGVQKK